MHSSIINKIEKARVYAEQRDRVLINSISVSFNISRLEPEVSKGNHNEYPVSCDNGVWMCACSFFESHSTCSHTMALERIFDGMLPKAASLRAAAE